LLPTRVLVTGSREWTDKERLWGALSALYTCTTHIRVIHGDCPTGADALAREWCSYHPYAEQRAHPADWEKHGKSAGYIRNAEMVTAGADVCLAFIVEGEGKSRGTRMTADLAAKAKIPVRGFIQEEDYGS
jgi:hypothetical protein